ncbi:FKBP-type peptidyl-prolyl cis-trans isomerase [Saccharicrinis fermentans]|uniref:Peptidyl-prolyl cis-trans isomerase n=1 Tax=Saccharicrinis fermentans DSM 9555 = JCM 21142 TaxID=869213 RepID=W7XTX2_9BACT|nr:FKBP-type peptidyl-prolyl cis-trans isomerase [Saccharicrinis fermentans]GAF01455.1 outer membrane protein MIP precursor [Saccharicrinis fermentans DSM 9555 = JCM 21142]
MQIKNLILGLGAVAVMAVSCTQAPSVKKVELKNEADSVSYALGYLNASQMSQQAKGPFDSIDARGLASVYVNAEFSQEMRDGLSKSFDSISWDVMKAGFINTLLGEDGAVFDQQGANAFLQSSYQAAQERKNMQPGMPGFENKKAGEAFLAENGKKANVVTTASGLQYEIIKEGKGPKPTPADKVKVHYHGTLLDGTVFDSSVDRGEPATFGVTQVIKGWTEALQLMPAGSKYKLFIPGNLAYGSQGQGAIGPNQLLVFEVELLDIVK